MVQEKIPYPVTVKGDLSSPPSRGWWLVKWLLAIPHYIILIFLWVACLISWLISLLSILITAKYPKKLFDFNVGVLRWTWRVGFYSYDALGTDKYPPFTLQPVSEYPAELEVAYPERLSRGLVLVKWWILAIPHYIVTSIFSGGTSEGNVGLTFILSIFGAVAVLFTGKYPEGIFRLVVGMNRWSIRVAAYAMLMTDSYPPFRLWDEEES